MQTRRSRPLAPEEIQPSNLPEPLVEDGEPVTVDEAADTYMRIQRHNTDHDTYTSRYDYARHYQYPRILEADRHFQTTYGDDLTTCMLTRRVSPATEDHEFLTPWEIDEMLNGGGIRRAIRQALDYHLGDFDFEWIAVTTPDETYGTPYELIYLWVDDSGDAVEVDHLEPALERHMERCPNALSGEHYYRSDGTRGAIQIQHDPEIVSEPPDRLVEIFAESGDSRGDSEPRAILPTTGALHVATSLSDLVVGQDDPLTPLVEGAAAGWAVPHHWFRCSDGVPDLD